LISFGGGSIGNITGLAAGLIFRGIRFIEVPTTLSHQTDGMLRKLDALGFNGPVVLEPWNAQLREMNPVDAVEKVKLALDLSLKNAGIIA
jgi:hypothetical protein